MRRICCVRAGKVHGDYVKAAAKLDAAHCGTLPDARPGPVELKLASLGPVQPLVVGHYGEMGGLVDELLELAVVTGATKHWKSMRCRDPRDYYAGAAPIVGDGRLPR